jgi:putative membrane protein
MSKPLKRESMKPFEIKSKPSSIRAEQGRATPSQEHLSDHLANERTYLAYLRTAISLISFGVTINRFSLFLIQSGKFPEHALPRWDMIGVSRVGIGMVVFGIALMLWAGIHFSKVGRAIDRGSFRPNELSAWIITAGVLLGGGISLLWLFPH